MNETFIQSTPYLLSIALLAVAFLLVLIMYLRVHAFAALIVVSAATALLTGISLDSIVPTMLSGFGSTLASVALLVGLGAMIGKILEQSGGAQVLADTLINAMGKKYASFALGIASLLFALPIFFDAGLVVMLPVILTVAKRLGGSILLYAMPSVGAFSVMHVFLPPHPGPVAASGILGANVGLLIFIGLIVALPTWFISSYLYGLWCGKKWHIEVSDLFGSDDKQTTATQNANNSVNKNNAQAEENNESADSNTTDVIEAVVEPERKLPAFKTVLAILLTPVFLIFTNTTISTLQATGVFPKNGFFSFLLIFGQTPIALLITLLVAVYIFRKQFDKQALEKMCDKALGPICSVVLVTGAGGMFGGILRASGIGGALSNTLSDMGIPVITAAFLIAACLRVAQGSATVALTTTAALIAPAVTAGTYSQVELCSIVIAVAGGSVVLSHFNDSGFWLFKGLFNVDEKTTLRTWTVLETLIGTIGFAFAYIIFTVLG